MCFSKTFVPSCLVLETGRLIQTAGKTPGRITGVRKRCVTSRLSFALSVHSNPLRLPLTTPVPTTPKTVPNPPSPWIN